ncbi:MAG: aminotransferase class V-fold PLP-dependent enzyme [Thermoprotei archaeon]|nr:aminotransferase class V-fold PLP-dependent enzyme [Thermoprotei archaeon]
MFEGVRSKIRILERYVYLDNASSGPLPDPVVDAVKSFSEYWALSGEPWDEGIEALLEVKRLFSSFIGASHHNVAAFPGVTYGLGVILSSLKVRRGSNIVVGSHNFPTSIIMARALERAGVIGEVREADAIKGGFEVYEKLVDDNTSMVMVDYVGWLSGHVEDIRELADIAHSHGAILVTDAFHAIGVMPVDVKSLDVDVLITGSYKWLMSIHGAALAYIRGELLESMEPPIAGWMSIEDSVVKRMIRGEPEFERPLETSRIQLAEDASKLELGTQPLIAYVALREALKFLIEHEATLNYESHTWRLAEELAEELQNLGFTLYTPRERHSAIITFKHREPHKLAGELERRGVKVAARPQLIRVSPHFYNTREDVYKLLEALKKIKGEP